MTMTYTQPPWKLLIVPGPLVWPFEQWILEAQMWGSVSFGWSDCGEDGA